jgi:hypothetical protein
MKRDAFSLPSKSFESRTAGTRRQVFPHSIDDSIAPEANRRKGLPGKRELSDEIHAAGHSHKATDVYENC